MAEAHITKFRVKLEGGGTAILTHCSGTKPTKADIPKLRKSLIETFGSIMGPLLRRSDQNKKK